MRSTFTLFLPATIFLIQLVLFLTDIATPVAESHAAQNKTIFESCGELLPAGGKTVGGPGAFALVQDEEGTIYGGTDLVPLCITTIALEPLAPMLLKFDVGGGLLFAPIMPPTTYCFDRTGLTAIFLKCEGPVCNGCWRLDRPFD